LREHRPRTDRARPQATPYARTGPSETNTVTCNRRYLGPRELSDETGVRLIPRAVRKNPREVGSHPQ